VSSEYHFDPFARVVAAAEANGSRPRGSNPDYRYAFCPVCNKRKPSVSILRGHSRIVINAFCGCLPEDVKRAWGLREADVRHESPQKLEAPNTEDLLRRWKNHEIKPVKVACDAEALKAAPADVQAVVLDMYLQHGLRERVGYHRPLVYPIASNATRHGWTKMRMSRAINQAQEYKFVSWVDTLERRNGYKNGAKCYLPVPVTNARKTEIGAFCNSSGATQPQNENTVAQTSPKREVGSLLHRRVSQPQNHVSYVRLHAYVTQGCEKHPDGEQWRLAEGPWVCATCHPPVRLDVERRVPEMRS